MFYLPDTSNNSNNNSNTLTSNGFYTKIDNLSKRIDRIESTDKQVAQYIFNKYNEPVFLSGTHDFYGKEALLISPVLHLDLGKIYTIAHKLVHYDENGCTCNWTTMQGRQVPFSSSTSKRFSDGCWQTIHEFVYSPFKRTDCYLTFSFDARKIDKSESFLLIRQI